MRYRIASIYLPNNGSTPYARAKYRKGNPKIRMNNSRIISELIKTELNNILRKVKLIMTKAKIIKVNILIFLCPASNCDIRT
jgi:hypothetical protein